MSDDRPKHKPQKKHTLEEVLKSLQDLIRNDLIAAQGVTGRPKPPALEPPSPPTDSFDTALDTLDHLIDHELVEPVSQARAAPPPPDDELPQDEDWPDDDTVIGQSLAAEETLNANGADETEPASRERAAPAPPAAPRGVQDAFSFDAPTGDAAASDAEDRAGFDTDVAGAADAAAEAPDTSTPAVPATPDDDIPVLHEVAHEILSAPGTLPTPEQARDIAVHVVARLNIELRRGGAQPLDPSTIDRLQKLLREALASKSSGNP